MPITARQAELSQLRRRSDCCGVGTGLGSRSGVEVQVTVSDDQYLGL